LYFFNSTGILRALLGLPAKIVTSCPRSMTPIIWFWINVSDKEGKLLTRNAIFINSLLPPYFMLAKYLNLEGWG
jgi:hypothetical protein